MFGKDMFGRNDFGAMAKQLAGMKRRFLMSINDVPEVRSIFGRFEQRAVKTTYSIGVSNRRSGAAGELLFANFKWDD